MLNALFASGDINEDSLHDVGGGFEELPAVREHLISLAGDLEPSLVNKRGRLECLARALLGHSGDREASKLFVNEGQQTIRGALIPSFRRIHELGDFRHG